MIQNSASLSLCALNFYRGTQIESPKKFRGLIRRAVRLAQLIHDRFGIKLEEINLGGGLPSFRSRRVGIGSLGTRFRADWPLGSVDESIEAFASQLTRMFAEELHAAGLPYHPALALEPGRSIVADAGILIARVHIRKGRWLYVDASRNFLAESFLFLCRQILPVNMKDHQERRVYHVSGNTLNTTDILEFWRRLPEQQPDDCLVFCAAGAYTISRATRYAGLPPAIYLLDRHGAVRLIRAAEDAGVFQRSSNSNSISSNRQNDA
jgi:diaminopimelate decarboxylase